MSFNALDFLVGHQPRGQQFQTLTQPQMSFINQLIGGAQPSTMSAFDYLQGLLSGNPDAFAAFEGPYKQQFEQEIVPGIAERFAGMGTGGAMDSSAFQQTLGRAGRELSTSLAALREGLKSQAVQGLQGMINPSLSRSFENVYDPGSYGVLGGFLQGLGHGAGKATGQYFLG